MKLDSESPYQHTRPLHENETKLIVHCDNAFIIAKDNHFIIDLLNMDKESTKEGKHDHKSHFERKSSEVACPPKQHLNVDDTLNINKSDYECVNPLYSATASVFEMVVKEDFYTDQIVTKAEFPEVRVCIEDDPCHIVRDISIDEGLHFSHKSLVEKEEGIPIEYSISNQTLENGSSDKVVENEQMGPIKSSISNKTMINDHDDSKSVMESSVGSDDSKHTVFHCSISNVKMGQSDPASVLRNASDGKGSFAVTENLLDPATVIYDDYDGKEFQASSINSEDALETTNSVVCSTSAKVIEIQAVSDSDFHNDCDARGSYVSLIDGQNKLGSYESVVTNAHGKGYSLSSINSEGNLNTTTSEFSSVSVGATKNRAVSVSEGHNIFDVDGSHVSSICIVDKENTDESIVHNISQKVSSASSINSEDCLDTISVLTNISAEVKENQEGPVSVVCSTSAKVIEIQAVSDSDFHNDCDAKGSYVSSIDGQNKLGSYELVVTNAHGKGYSLSSINSEGNLNTTTSEFSNVSVGATKNRAVSVSEDHNIFDVDGSHVSSICIVDKVNTDESIVRNIFRKVSSASSINSEDCLDTISVLTYISAEVIENQAVPVSGVHNDCEGRESYNSSVDSQNKQDTYKSVVSNVSAEFVENQLPPSLKITADSLNVNSSGQTCSNDKKQSVDGQEFQTISEETNLPCPALNFPSEVPALSNGSEESSSNCKVPTGVITFSFDTEEASTSGRDENVETTNSQKSEVTQNSLGIDDPSASIRCSSLRFIQEESNLYGPALLPGHNLNSGNLLYSGSVSIRSESSTGSTRSFAFPILQSEWNSSPVKMAKADRRRKYRGWKMGLTCCRF